MGASMKKEGAPCGISTSWRGRFDLIKPLGYNPTVRTVLNESKLGLYFNLSVD